MSWTFKVKHLRGSKLRAPCFFITTEGTSFTLQFASLTQWAQRASHLHILAWRLYSHNTVCMLFLRCCWLWNAFNGWNRSQRAAYAQSPRGRIKRKQFLWPFTDTLSRQLFNFQTTSYLPSLWVIKHVLFVVCLTAPEGGGPIKFSDPFFNYFRQTRLLLTPTPTFVGGPPLLWTIKPRPPLLIWVALEHRSKSGDAFS